MRAETMGRAVPWSGGSEGGLWLTILGLENGALGKGGN